MGSPRIRQFKGISEQKYLVCRRCDRAQRQRKRLRPGADVRERAALADSIVQRFRSQADRIVFNVLVWGPTPASADPAAVKRREVREALEADGHRAFFSEDLGFPTDRPVPADVQELAQLTQCQLVVNIGASFGSQGEAHEYGVQLGNRLLLWLPLAAREGFIGSGLAQTRRTLGGATVFYNDLDVKSCAIRLASSDWVEARRHTQWFIDAQRAALSKLDLFSN